MDNRIKLNLVDGKKVAIITSNTHTYNVRFVKSGKFMEIHKSYVKTVYVTPKPIKTQKKDNNQGQLGFNF